MDWSRGLFRLWVAASAAWVLVICVTSGPSYVAELRAVSSPTASQTTERFILPSDRDELQTDEEVGLSQPTTIGVVANAAKVFALPPLILLAVGMTLRWVAVGFRRERS